MPDSQLPIDTVLPALCQSVQQHETTILQAPPGAGKTTQVPLALLELDAFKSGKILLLQPRRIAAQQACYRLSQKLGQAPGEQVGYKMRLAQKVSAQTRLEVITEGVLLRYLHSDPSLSDIQLIIFDECHERSLNADLALSLILQAKALFDCQTKLLFMSASLDTQPFEQLLPEAKLICSEGRSYPITTHFMPQAVKLSEVVEQTITTIKQLLANPPDTQLRDILVFLPGQKEIHHVQRTLEQSLGLQSQVFLPLYGQLALEQQAQVLKADPQARQKIILATNIAETSLTIDGIGIVVDSGLMRKAHFHAKTATTKLSTQRISQAQALQRSGRAGRLAPGLCYRIWSQEQQYSLAASPTPEIIDADLSDLCLQLYQWGCPDIKELEWLDQPNTFSYEQAQSLLRQLKALENYELSALGQWMNSLACPVRIASLLIHGALFEQVEASCRLAALLDDKHQAKQLDLAQIPQYKLTPQQSQLAKRYQQQLSQSKPALEVNAWISAEQKAAFAKLDAPQQLSVLLLISHPDKVAEQIHNNRYKLANGRQAELKQTLKSPYIIALDSAGFADAKTDTIYQAVAIEKNWLELFLPEAIEHVIRLEWPHDRPSCLCYEQQSYGALNLASKDLPIAQYQSQALAACLDYIRHHGLSLFDDYANFSQLLARLGLLQGNITLGDLEPLLAERDANTSLEQALIYQLEIWLAPFLDGIFQRKQLQAISLEQALLAQLDYGLQQEIKQLAPLSIKIPSGRQAAIDYSSTPPKLSVKLQEMFGCAQSPTINQGRTTLLIELLSPAQRPLQLTQDLGFFWQNAYQDVKKEMKGRYPKHPWPDDPLSFEATAKTKRHL